MPTPDPLARRPRLTTLTMAGMLATSAGMLALSPAAWAQKNSGPLLPLTPEAPAIVQPPIRPQAPRPPSTTFAAPRPGPAAANPGGPNLGGTNPDVERLARTLPLDPQTRELPNSVPPDRTGTERRLGLHEPHGPVTDMRGRTPSPREIVDALAPR